MKDEPKNQIDHLRTELVIAQNNRDFAAVQSIMGKIRRAAAQCATERQKPMPTKPTAQAQGE